MEYTINDLRGIFRPWIFIRDKKISKTRKQKFKDHHVKFEILPNQTIDLGDESITEYDDYKQFDVFDPEYPDHTFLNVTEIKIYNDTNSFTLKTDKMDQFLSENSHKKARIEIDKLITLNDALTP